MALADFAGFGIRGYRSFGGDLARIGPMGKIHLVVGQNNVGKSNTLRVVGDLLPALRDSEGSIEPGRLFPGAFDRPEGWDITAPVVASLGLRLTSEVRDALSLSHPAVDEWLSCEAYTRGSDDVVWLDLEFEFNVTHNRYGARLSQAQVAAAQAEGTGFGGDLGGVSSALTQRSGSLQRNLDGILERWQPWRFIPQTVWIDAVRQITAEGSENFRTGEGIVNKLAALERPPRRTYATDRAQFEALERFVRDVLEDAHARIEIPDQKNTILVHGRTGMRELGDLGTGINELILIATVASINRDSLVCIEEPELHLHPTLQRKLINYINRHTENHYLISTHSAAMLNADVATITHLEMPDRWSVASHVITPGDLARVASDLGNRASDIVQSNFVIWVEGPSDRLYIRRWLELYDPDLVEAAHFSIMFYGGALLSHLAVDDDEVGDFINLLRISRNLAIIIDSDRSDASDTLNATKVRVIDELEAIGALHWVTEGYTIENYLPRADLQAAIARLYPAKSYTVPTSSFKSPLGNKFTGTDSKPSKTTVGRHLVSQPMDLANYSDHLIHNLEMLSAAIRRANGLAARSTG